MRLNITKKQGLSVIFTIVTVSIILIIIGYFLLNDTEEKSKNIKVPTSNEEIEWILYENEEYGFRLEYPVHWEFYEDDKVFGIAFNFYPKREKEIDLPYAFFHNVDQFGVYPIGIDTEGISGARRQSDVKFGEETKDSVDQVLKEGKIWGTHITPLNPPARWQSWGFIWLGSKIDNLEYSCTFNNKEIPVEECDPFSGGNLHRSGEVNPEIREVLELIAESFEFI